MQGLDFGFTIVWQICDDAFKTLGSYRFDVLVLFYGTSSVKLDRVELVFGLKLAVG